jgi:chromosome segregation ATPase
LTDITDHTLNIWIGQKYLDAKTQKTLKQAIDLRQEAAKIDRLLQDLEKQRLSVHDEQKRIRENLQAIGDRPGEKELRERYLKTLNSQEDRLEKIDKDAKKNIEARDDCREKMNVILAKLEYDAELADL